MAIEFEFDLINDSECGSVFEHARRRAPVNTGETSGCGPALDPHRRELHDVPMLRSACEDYRYLRRQEKWNRVRAAWAAFRRAGLRLQVLAGAELFRPAALITVAMVLVFAAGVLVGGAKSWR